jgi:hypothetical protein
LTNSQKQKLQLAGRGDSTRLFDRIDMIGARIQLARHDREKIYHLLDDAQSLQHDLIRPGLSSDGSLFFKSLERLLSVEQSIKYAPLRAIVRAGGLVRVRWDGARELLEISLPGTTFVDEKLVNLHELPGPHVLVLAKSQVTDAGLVHLAGLTSLQTLVLNKTRVTDKGLAELKGLTGLRELALDETPVTDAGLEHVQGLTGLQHISVKATGVSDAGLAHLKGLNRLESLVLDETEVTDAGLVHLKGLTNLQLLLVRRTTVTNSGVAQLKRTLPRLAIHK